MQPTYQVSVNGSDRTSVFQQRLISLSLHETTGKEADRLELTFDDRGNVIVLPAHGAVITLSIGYVGQALTAKGSFTVDTSDIEGPPDKVIVNAKSSDMRQSLKAHKSRAWRSMSVGAIVAQIAAENGLAAQVHPSLSSVQVDHRDQTNESDLHFMSRLGVDNDAIAASKGGKLLFVPRGLAVSSSGQALTALQLRRSDLTSWRRRDSDRTKFGSVRAKHRDMTGAALNYVVAGSGDPTGTLRHVYPSAALAMQAAHAAHRRGKRKASGIELDVTQGVPTAFAGQQVTVSEVRDGINGAWIAAEVDHDIDFDSGGYTMRITATVNGQAEDTGDDVTNYAGDDTDPDVGVSGDE